MREETFNTKTWTKEEINTMYGVYSKPNFFDDGLKESKEEIELGIAMKETGLEDLI